VSIIMEHALLQGQDVVLDKIVVDNYSKNVATPGQGEREFAPI